MSARSNLWLGSVEKYMKKRLGKNADLIESLEKLVDYLKQSKELEPILHGAIIDAEKTRITRWKNETIYNKLVEKGLDLKQLNEYDKRRKAVRYLYQFINQGTLRNILHFNI